MQPISDSHAPPCSAFERACGIGSYEWRPGKDLLDWSPGLLHIYGIEKQPEGEKDFTRFVLLDDRVRVEAEISSFLSSNATSYSHSFRIVRPDGTVRHILDRGTIERNAHGQVLVMHGLNIDMTEFAQSGSVPDSEARLAVALEGANAGIWESVPATGEFIASDAALKLLGFAPGTPMTHEKALSVIHPDDRPRVEDALRNAVNFGMPFNLDLRCCLADGSVVWINSRAHVRTRDGAHSRMIGIVQDITEQKQTETALAASEQRFKLALSNSPITIFEQDADLRYRWLYNYKLGFSDATTLGKTDDEIMEPTAAALLTAFKRKVLEGGEKSREVVVVAMPGQPPGYFDLHLHARRDESGRIIGLTGVSTDITEQRCAEKALGSAQDTVRHLVEHSPFGVYAVDANFRLVQVSEGAQKVFENVRPLLGRDFAEVLRYIWPEPFATEAIGRFQHTLATGESYHAPGTVEKRADIGAVEAYDWKIERLMLSDGRPGVVCHFYDLSELRRHDEHTRLVMQEVNHRFKNVLGLVQSIARQTIHGNVEDFNERFTLRLQSLAAAQDLIIKHNWKEAPLAELVVSQLGHFADLIDTRIAIDGPEILLTPSALEALGMAIHELATNAAKYGALLNETGRVVISWKLNADADNRLQFTMSWKEQDGPPVSKPEQTGFGTMITTRALMMNLNGEVSVSFEPVGLIWLFTCPADAILSSKAPALL